MLCAGCQRDLPRSPLPACPVCAAPSDGNICGRCLKHPPAFDRAIAGLCYEFPADKLVQALKYNGQLAFAPLLAGLLLPSVREAPRPTQLIPMPLHPLRARQRGFNQATEIGKILAKELQIPLVLRGLERVRDTVPQASLPLDERRKNVKDAFACSIAFTGQHVAVLDDVMTSGATLGELSATLKRAGASEVSVWVAARALPQSAGSAR
jgi:ComF family protein